MMLLEQQQHNLVTFAQINAKVARMFRKIDGMHTVTVRCEGTMFVSQFVQADEFEVGCTLGDVALILTTGQAEQLVDKLGSLLGDTPPSVEKSPVPETNQRARWLDWHCYACGVRFTHDEHEVLQRYNALESEDLDLEEEVDQLTRRQVAQTIAYGEEPCEMCGKGLPRERP